MPTTNILRIPDEDRATSVVLAEWERRRAAGTACMYRQPWLTGIPWVDKCMGDPVVVWYTDERYCAEHALSEGPPAWDHEAAEVTILPDCPPGVADEVRARVHFLRARAEGTDGYDWRAEFIAAVEFWAAHDGADPGCFSTVMAVEPFAEDLDPDGTMGRVQLALAGAIAERRRLAATTK